MFKIKHAVVTALFVMCVAAPSLGATIEEIEKELVAAIRKTKSFKANMKTNVDLAMQGVEIKSVSEQSLETLRDGEKFKMRSEGTSKSSQKMGGMEQNREQKMLTVCDGEFTFTEVETEGVKDVSKTDPVTGEELPWQHYGKDVKINVLPDEKIDGADCYVVEVKMAGQSPGMGKMVFYCRKDCGIQAKTVGYTPDDKVMMTTIISDIELNKGVSAERFVYKAPDGVTVRDATNIDTPKP